MTEIMSRQIKFRAWHFQLKKMFSSDEMTHDQLALLPNGLFANIDGDNTSRSRIYSHDEILPMQFTGLKDKNGKEIWEGDIISYTFDSLLLKAEITWNIHCGWWQYKYENAIGGHATDKLWELLTNTRFPKNVTVIGNIHENPELLK